MKKKCIIFDMDGLLVDSESAYIRAWKEAFDQKKIPIDIEEIYTWAGKGFKYINEVVENYTGSHEKMLEIRELREVKFWEALENGNVKIMKGVPQILEFGKNAGLKMGVATSTVSEKGERILEYFKIKKYFDFLVFGDMVENHKPHPDLYLRGIELSGFSKDECIAFEDSVSGVKSTIATGVDVCYVPDVGDRISADTKVLKQLASIDEGIEVLKNLI